MEVEPARTDASASLSDEEAVALSSGLIEAKHEETQAQAKADALVGGPEFEVEDEEAETEETDEQVEETHAAEDGEVSEEQTEEEDEEAEELTAHELAEAEADAAHESAEAEHAAAIGEHAEGEVPEHEVIQTAPGEHAAAPRAVEEDTILLPGETRAPRSASAPREDFPPRDSARIGGNPRARFQRPFRGGGRDRGRDNRGGRPDHRGGRPGQRFERRPSGPGGPRQERG
jgi:hypothetical protein